MCLHNAVCFNSTIDISNSVPKNQKAKPVRQDTDLQQKDLTTHTQEGKHPQSTVEEMHSCCLNGSILSWLFAIAVNRLSGYQMLHGDFSSAPGLLWKTYFEQDLQ